MSIIKTNDMNLTLMDFDGPLDLLLNLIKDNKMDIMNLDILSLANQYLAYIYDKKNEINIETAGEYLLMAATLINIKSKKMMAFADNFETKTSEFDFEKDKLIKQILEYKKYKDVLPKLIQKFNKRLNYFSKNSDNIEEVYPVNKNISFKMPNQISIDKLYKAMQNVFENWKNDILINQKIIVQELSFEDVEKDVIRILDKKNKQSKISFSTFLSFVDPINLSNQYFVACFVALLELVKYGKILLFQKQMSDDIYIERLKGENYE